MAKKTASVAALAPNPKNPRKVTKAKLSMLQKSMAKFGDLSGIVVNRRSGQIVGGHQRREAFMALKTDAITIERAHDEPTDAGTVAEGYVDMNGERFSYRETDWPPDVEAAANLSANKGAGQWELPMVADMLGELDMAGFDLDLTMFDAAERSSLLGDEVEQKPIQDDEGISPPDDPVTKTGDVYRLGQHVLHCGDSSDHIAFAEQYDVIFTDPPYGVNFVSGRGRERGEDWGPIHNDSLDGESLQTLLRAAVPKAKSIFVCCDWASMTDFVASLGRPNSVCVWDKKTIGFGSPYRRQHEFILFYGTLNRKDLSDVWPCERASNYQHPTQKPVPLIAKALSDVAGKGATVYDPFGGSGSTLLAAEQLGMAATLVEFEPKYCDVIVARWEKLTGQKAELLPRED